MVAAAGALALKMVIAAFSGMGAATFCHPLDVIRVQMQTEGAQFKSAIDCASAIIAQEGFGKGLYAGIGAAFLRQWLYGSCRIGIYAFLLENAQNKNLAAGLEKNAIPIQQKLLMGVTSGGIGSLVGCPAEIALVRLSADSKLPQKERRNYKNVADCITRIANEEGIGNLWRGARVTVVRAMVLSACVMGITSEMKQQLTKTGIFGDDGQMLHGLPLLLLASIISSFFANVFSNPFDVVKSRTQNQRVEKDGSTRYNGMIDTFGKIISEEGVLKLWAGFVPAFIKLAPFTVISLILTDKITQLATGRSAL
jgi:solute carrier family 25 oxoglutarate transporter 11